MEEFIDSLKKFWDNLNEETKVAVYIAVSGVLARLLVMVSEIDAIWALVIGGIINVTLVYVKNKIRALR